MRTRLNALTILALTAGWVLPTILWSGGCEHAKQRTVDVEAGEYYTEDELVLLPVGIKNKYCQDLESERGRAQQGLEAKSTELTQTNDQIAVARARRDGLERDLIVAEAELRTLDDQLGEVKALPTTWKIRQGEDLAVIAALPEIYNDRDKWWRILEANKYKIPDPFYCFPDTMIVIPRDWPVD